MNDNTSSSNNLLYIKIFVLTSIILLVMHIDTSLAAAPDKGIIFEINISAIDT